MEACNFIAQDDNWKKRVESEGDAAKRWADKWGFLKTPLEEVNFANRPILQKSYGWSFRTAHTEMLLGLIPSHQSQRWKQVSPTSATKDVFLQVLSRACDEITAEA
ncbi:ciliary microtubule inner protein 1 isoform X2 [Aphelocoma coerulescens]|uniref:ciliary microtubule inner protein 1 isoform X2 n=1 Tax=Aphelocoma coerulescens TaxID=39617 RepID=UPI0036043E71